MIYFIVFIITTKANKNDNQLTQENGTNETTTTTTLRDDNVLPAKDWFLEGALSAFQSIRNVATLRLKEEDFVKEVEIAFRKFVEFINNIRMTQIEENFSISTSNQKRIPQHGEELWMTCFPLFVHIFIQLFECGHVSNGKCSQSSLIIQFYVYCFFFWFSTKFLHRTLSEIYKEIQSCTISKFNAIITQQ